MAVSGESIRICQYNMGADISDYLFSLTGRHQLHLYLHRKVDAAIEEALTGVVISIPEKINLCEAVANSLKEGITDKTIINTLKGHVQDVVLQAVLKAVADNSGGPGFSRRGPMRPVLDVIGETLRSCRIANSEQILIAIAGTLVKDAIESCLRLVPEGKKQEVITAIATSLVRTTAGQKIGSLVPDDVYRELQEKSAERLTGDENVADVYCLQECSSDLVGDRVRPLITKLTEKGFQLFSVSRRPKEYLSDSVIAINPRVFKDISLIFASDSPIVQATHRVSGRRYTFVSSHVPGYDLNQAVPEGREELEEGVDVGDSYCHAIAARLNQAVAIPTFQIICADMNSYPERHTRRFQAFEQVGFECHRTGHPTEISGETDTRLPLRELDFIFSRYIEKNSYFSFFTKFFKSTPFFRTRIVKSPFGISVADYEINPSDHLPIIAEIIYTGKTPSYLNRLCAMIFSSLGNLFSRRSFARD